MSFRRDLASAYPVPPMDLWELKVFMTVAVERSFTQAAEKLYRTQPAVSQAISRLESTLGTRLFDRRSGALTPAGRVLQERGRVVLQMVGEAEAAVRQQHEPRRQIITIGANDAAVHALLPVIAAFRSRRPDVEIDVRRTHARHIPEEVLGGGLDFGVLTTHRVMAGLRTITIASNDLVVLVPPRHRLAGKRQLTMEEFHRETIIAHNDPSPARDYVLRAFSEKGLQLATMIQLPSLDAICRAVEMGLGIALLPRHCALAEIASGTLVAVPLRKISRSGALRLAFREEHDMSGEANDFLGTARDVSREGGGFGPVSVSRATL